MNREELNAQSLSFDCEMWLWLVTSGFSMKVSWNGAPGRVIAPSIIEIYLRTVPAKRVAFFGIRALKGGKFHPKLNMTTRLIANKYREGKAKRTLKRELKVLEIVKGEANIAVEFVGL
jgi:hypothetical protein